MRLCSLRSALCASVLCFLTATFLFAQVEQTTRTISPHFTSSIPAHTGSTPVPEKDNLVQPDHLGPNPGIVKPGSQSNGVGQAATSAQTNASANSSVTKIFTTPTPKPKPVLGPGAGFMGFNGLSHFDQRFAGTGPYTNTQFSLEPPDQALCTGNGFVMESVNNALAVYDKSGNLLQGPIANSQFFGLAPEVIRSTPPVFGPFISDPKCYYDKQTNRWFMSELEMDTDPATGGSTGSTSTLIAVSQTGDPTGIWNVYQLPTTDDGSSGTPTHPNCPCFGDQPLLGADANAIYISTNEFPVFVAGFNGAQVYAISKRALAKGLAANVVQFNLGTLPAPDGGTWYSVQPATVPPGGAFARNTEYFLSALQFINEFDDRVAVWAVTNTNTIDKNSPNLQLLQTVITSEVYGQPSPATQKAGPTPLGTAVGQSPLPELIDTNDDRMNQVVYADGILWSGLNTPVHVGSNYLTGIAYFGVMPWVGGKKLFAMMADQGYVAVSGNNVIFPSIAANNEGRAAMTFTLTGPDYYPSMAYMNMGLWNSGPVHVGGAGALPDDGFSGYTAYGGNGVGRWGDYTAGVADETGNLWIAAEYIPNATRSQLANWGTFVGKVPGDK
ncbi:MAG TPA: hypothetical protein VKW78_16815 [Terriglobales bacterium]|nr:hypothetical protein [Terriglobales bacterium]